jgi:hypothetical protein
MFFIGKPPKIENNEKEFFKEFFLIRCKFTEQDNLSLDNSEKVIYSS